MDNTNENLEQEDVVQSTVDDMGNINQNLVVETTDDSLGLPEYEFVGHFQSAHKKEIYGVEFYNFLQPKEPIIFATVGGNIVSIYECKHDCIEILQHYVDANDEEVYYTCSWSYNSYKMNAILAFGGLHGIIKIISPPSAAAALYLLGHCGAIHDLKFHPKDPCILLSASGDKTLRLWNIESAQCIAVFGGFEGHKDMVMSADFDSSGNRIISCGTENSIKIWRIDKSPIKEVIIRSFHVLIEENRPLRILRVDFPDFSTRDIEVGNVDCVKWVGNLVFSKFGNAIICWAPELVYTPIVRKFDIHKCTYLYMRFTLDSSKKYMAVGNEVGETFLWALQNENPTKYIVLKHKKCTTTVRHTAFSQDGKILICVCDNGSVHRYNMK